MKDELVIKSALISVYNKNGLDKILKLLHHLKIDFYSTGGTEEFIRKLNIPVQAVEGLTDYPSILGGRVKTLHPKIFGGILARREESSDLEDLKRYNIPTFDLVIVDLYPFEHTVASGASEDDIIEKIDIGGISLIRAGAKNFVDVCIISSPNQYNELEKILNDGSGKISLSQRRKLAKEAFLTSYHYDQHIFNYFNKSTPSLNIPNTLNLGEPIIELRYGENPHQKGFFQGKFDDLFEKIHGKDLSYNNMVDLDAGVQLMSEFTLPTFAILKHNNPCGIATAESILFAWKSALQGDPISAFGGVLISNRTIDYNTAEAINTLFFEVLVAPNFEPEALKLLMEKKNRILLQQKHQKFLKTHFKSLLNGFIYQDMDQSMENNSSWKLVSKRGLNESEIVDLSFGLKIVKHTKSNAIVITKNHQMIGIGVGQTSRVDALNQAIAKAGQFGFDLNGSSMASDAFFPFPDCVEIAAKAGITSIIQPGGSIKDLESIKACDENEVSMVLTSVRHFKH